MPDFPLPFDNSSLLTYLAEPVGSAPFPSVVVLSDALGMSRDLRAQCDWLASAGYRAAAPDLFEGKTVFSCVFKVIREFRKRQGSLFEKVETVRQYLLAQPDSNGKVGVIGFCFGGGFAILLSAGRGFDTASVNYGSLPKDADQLLENACPIVASYGKLDKFERGTAPRLQEILNRHGIVHDVWEYPAADHAFMNNHQPDELPFLLRIFTNVVGGGAYHEASCREARRRILAFFEQQLKGA